MEENITIHLGIKDINNFKNFLKGQKPFLEVDGNQVHSLGFDIFPSSDDFKAPKNHPNCCPYHKSIFDVVNDWYTKFPNCCIPHRAFAKKPWFKKLDYKNVPDKIQFAILFTDFHIARVQKNSDWFQDTIEYIDYIVDSFGSPSIGLHHYLSSIKVLILDKHFLPKYKGIRIANYLDKFYLNPKERPTSLNILFSTVQKWLKAFPNLLYFNELKEKYSNRLSLELIGYPSIYNRYSKRSKRKLRSNDELISFLFDLTRNHLSSIESTSLIESGIIEDPAVHYDKLLDEGHLYVQKTLFENYSKNELKYVEYLKKWLNNEETYFEKKVKKLNEDKNAAKLDALISLNDDYRNKLSLIQESMGSLNLNFEKFSIDNRNLLNDIILRIDNIDLDGIEADFEDDTFIELLNKVVDKFSEKLTRIEVSNLRQSIDNSKTLEVKEKFKVALGIGILKYEWEIENKSEWKLPSSWKEWKKIFIEEY